MATSDLFPIIKTKPDIACIRFQNSEKESTEHLASPFYNATLRSECCLLSYGKLMQETSIQSESFRDACNLGNVWLRQRGFDTGVREGGFGPFEWACLLSLLMHGGGIKGKAILSKGYSSLQIFRATLQFLSTRDLISSPLLLNTSQANVAQSSSPMVFDGSQGLNILFRMSTCSYALVVFRTYNLY